MREKRIIAEDPWIDIRTYGAKGNGKADDSKALLKALSVGNVLLPPPKKAWRFDKTIKVPAGRSISGVLGARSTIHSYSRKGDWAFVFDGIDQISGGGMSNFELHLKRGGANGILAYECKGGGWKNFAINGKIIGKSPTRYGGIGFLIDGGKKGAAWNHVEHFFIGYFREAGLRIDTSVYKNPWANRNQIGLGHIYGCGIGLDIVKGDTNFITLGPQDCNIGVRLGNGAKANYLFISEEGSKKRSLVFEKNSYRNMIYGGVNTDKIKDKRKNKVNTLMILPREFRLNDLNSNIIFKRTANPNAQRWIGTKPGSPNSIIVGVRDNTDAQKLVRVATARGNVPLPYLDADQGIRIQTGSYILSGKGTPEGTVAANPGSLYLNHAIGDGEYALYLKKTASIRKSGWEGLGIPK